MRLNQAVARRRLWSRHRQVTSVRHLTAQAQTPSTRQIHRRDQSHSNEIITETAQATSAKKTTDQNVFNDMNKTAVDSLSNDKNNTTLQTSLCGTSELTVPSGVHCDAGRSCDSYVQTYGADHHESQCTCTSHDHAKYT